MEVGAPCWLVVKVVWTSVGVGVAVHCSSGSYVEVKQAQMLIVQMTHFEGTYKQEHSETAC